MLFLQGGKSSICIVRCPSTSLERRAVFLREESLLLYLLLRLNQFGTLCHFPQGKRLLIIAQLDVLFDFLPLDEFGTSCCLLKGKHSSICIVVVTQQNLERHINFPPLDELELCAGFLRTKRISL